MEYTNRTYDDSGRRRSNIDQLSGLVMKTKERLLLSDLSSYQKDYISTTLSSLHAVLESLQPQYSQLPGQLYDCFYSLIMKFDLLIPDDKESFSYSVNETLQDDTPMKSLKFSTPIKNSFSRSSSISKAEITRENVLREPVHLDGNNFRRFTTPGIDNQFKHSITEVLRMSSPVRDDNDYSKSFESNNVFLD